jgi:hypothetical protein
LLHYFSWDDDHDVRFVLDQHAKLDWYNISSLKHQSAGKHGTPVGQSAGKHGTPVGHMIQTPNQPGFVLTH